MKMGVVDDNGKIRRGIMYTVFLDEETLEGIFNMMTVCVGEGTGGNHASDLFIHQLWDAYYPDKEKPWWYERRD